MDSRSIHGDRRTHRGSRWACTSLVALTAALGFEQVTQAESLPPVPPGTYTVASGKVPYFPCGPFTLSQSAVVEIAFPEVTWRVTVENRGLKALWLGLVELKRQGDADFNVILESAGIAEIFVPYHSGSPRLYDMQFAHQPHGNLDELSAADLPAAGGSLITLSGDHSPRVALEYRDRGLAWLCKTPVLSLGSSRRGQEAVLWSVLDTGNYDYVIEYGFRDDGTITFRLGATGYNNPGSPFEAHMHNVLWRVDADLFGSAHDDAVEIEEHVESGLVGVDIDTSIAFEGSFQIDPELFTRLTIKDTLEVNAYGNESGYELVPWDRTGSARHFGTSETWTHDDLYVTVDHGNDGWMTNFDIPDNYLVGAGGIGNGESLAGQDVMLWYVGAFHHEPHDEDHATGDPPNDMTGITALHWCGFNLVPKNLFSANPLGGPGKCEPIYCPLPAQCQALYRFDDTLQVGLDSVRGNDGTAVNGAGAVSGLFDTALALDGSNDHVSVPDDPTLDFGVGSFTIEGWIQPDSLSGLRAIVDKRTSGGGYHGYVLFTQGNKLGVQVASGTFGNCVTYSSAPIATLTTGWQHVAAVVTRGSNPAVRLYRNGVLIHCTTLALGPTASIDNAGALYVGKDVLSIAQHFDGRIDDLGLYDRALTEGELECIFQAGAKL